MNRIEDVYGLTPVQQGMYTQYFLNRKTESYHQYYLFSVNGNTDIELLQHALELLPLRHPVLKTAFAVVEGEVKQVIVSNRLPRIEVRRFEARCSSGALKNAVRAEAARPFDLQKDPLVRCTFLLFENRRFLFFHTHHLIFDGWCASALFEDLTAYYRALSGGEPTGSLKNRIMLQRSAEPSFADYVNLILQRDPGEAQRYWQNLLKGAQPSALPRKRSPGDGPGRFHVLTQALPQEISLRIQAFSRANALPENTVFESAFALALQKHTGRKEALFYKVVSGRSFVSYNIRRTVGPMINTVPVRLCRDADQTVSGFLQKTNEQVIAANEYGFLPLAHVCRGSGVDPHAVDVVFDYGNYTSPGVCERQPVSLLKHGEQTEFPLAVVLSPSDHGFLISVSYNTAMFTQTMVGSLIGSFRFILERLSALNRNALSDPAVFAELLRLTPAESRSILGVRGGTSASPAESGFCTGPAAPIPECSVYELFRCQAEKTPEAPAVLFKEQSLSYAALLRQTDNAADLLRQRGVEEADVVAVLIHRSPLLFVLQLAVMKLGAVFLPLDQRLPEERLRFICRDCGVRLLITDAVDARRLEVAAAPQDFLEHSAAVPRAEARRGDVCCIIYTSGSTGAPKGCLLKSVGIVNFCINNNTLPDLRRNPRNVFACVNSVAFDYFIAESLLPLLNGFTVALCDENESVRQNEFFSLVKKHGINVLMTTPTRLSLFYNENTVASAMENMDCVCSSGEPLTEPLLQKIYACSPRASVFNPLGPSECSVWNLGGALRRADGGDIHLGKPIANTQVYILNDAMFPVPVGVVGEICIAGAGVGGGYQNRPALTAEKFVDNPFGAGKLYKTGDLAYWRENGNAVFAGRNDFQMKLNGQRVEPGEIEAALSSFRGVKNAAVVLQKDVFGRQTLFACYTGEKHPAAELRAYLSEKLPSYMVPQAFAHMNALPLTQSGKIDRVALGTMQATDCVVDSACRSPLTQTEQAVCNAFAAVLGVKNVGRDANFYDLGGTSLLLIRLLSQPPLNALTPSGFLLDPTPAGLAKKLDAAKKTHYTYLVPLYTPSAAKKAFVLFPFAGGDVAAYTALIAKAHEEKRDFALYFVDWPREGALTAIEKELRTLAETTEVSFYSHCAGAAIALELLDSLNEPAPLIKQYVAGASIPPRRSSGFNIWAHLSDAAIIRSLQRAGLGSEPESEAVLRTRLESFRENTKAYGAYFRGKKTKTNVSVKAVISRNDPFTSNYADARSNWSRVVSVVEDVVLIDTPSHYFQNTDTGFLLDLFSES